MFNFSIKGGFQTHYRVFNENYLKILIGYFWVTIWVFKY